MLHAGRNARGAGEVIEGAVRMIAEEFVFISPFGNIALYFVRNFKLHRQTAPRRFLFVAETGHAAGAASAKCVCETRQAVSLLKSQKP